MPKRVLVLAPHTDDGEFGAGATLAKWNGGGAELHYVAFSTCEQSVPDGLPKNILATEVKEATLFFKNRKETSGAESRIISAVQIAVI